MLKALQFHRIINKFQFCGTWNYPEQLDRFIRVIYDNGYEIVLPGENKDGLIITFDDGEENLYYYAFPILKKYHCRAIIFLIAGYIGKENTWDISIPRNRYLSWKQILDMQKYGIVFGSHTMTHRNLTRLGINEIEYEVVESKKYLERYLGEVEMISYPFNRVNEMVLKIVKKAGYKYGFGGDGNGQLCIKKEAIYITDNALSLKIKISEKPVLLYRYELIQQRVINYFTIATMLRMSKKEVL
jgi:peptidoglycan/xylan/chitin deacetylase (PgdA/CDA1 family)|uniref:Polysaccharide deacetylase family protein n=1 Tax=candidate division WOR-3 bacterium TaxID=2052148 RepID=A0A7V3RI92_UNCW3